MSLESELEDLEEDYPYQSPYVKRKDLVRINQIRAELDLQEVDSNLNEMVELEEIIELEPDLKARVEVDIHAEARGLYQGYQDKLNALEPHIEYSNKIIFALSRGRSHTPVMPLATGGGGGGPLLCDRCKKAILLEGGQYNRMPADEAWGRHPSPDASWMSYISGGLIYLQETNGTVRIYHGYMGNSSHCCTIAEKADEARRNSFERDDRAASRAHSVLEPYLEDEFPDLSSEERRALRNTIVNTLYSFDPGVGINRPSGKKVGRNSPCPCGSKVKYKNCCGGKDS